MTGRGPHPTGPEATFHFVSCPASRDFRVLLIRVLRSLVVWDSVRYIEVVSMHLAYSIAVDLLQQTDRSLLAFRLPLRNQMA